MKIRFQERNMVLPQMSIPSHGSEASIESDPVYRVGLRASSRAIAQMIKFGFTVPILSCLLSQVALGDSRRS